MTNPIINRRRDGRSSPGASLRYRWLTLGILLGVAALLFARFREESGSTAFALAGVCLAMTLLILPLRCQLDPCKG